MATNNIKIFDQNKVNMLTDEAYNTSTQRLNGVQQGIASSQLQNKTLYQVSLVAYAIGQMMQANGLNASDADAVSTFAGNLSSTIVQKILDKADTTEAKNFTANDKFITPQTWKVAYDFMKADSDMVTSAVDDTHYITPKLLKEGANLFGGGIEIDDGTLSKWMTASSARIQIPDARDAFPNFSENCDFLCSENKTWFMILCNHVENGQNYIYCNLYDYGTSTLQDTKKIKVKASISALKCNNSAFIIADSLDLYFYQITSDIKFGKSVTASKPSELIYFEQEQDSYFESDDNYLYFAAASTKTLICYIFNVSDATLQTLTLSSSLSSVYDVKTIFGLNKTYYIVCSTGATSIATVTVFILRNGNKITNVQVTNRAGAAFISCSADSLVVFAYDSNRYYYGYKVAFSTNTVSNIPGSISAGSSINENNILVNQACTELYIFKNNNYVEKYAIEETAISYIGNVGQILKKLFYNKTELAQSIVYSVYYYIPLSFKSVADYTEIDEKVFYVGSQSPIISNIRKTFRAPLIGLCGAKLKD